MSLSEPESKKSLSQAGIKVNDTKLATSRAEAIAISRQLGFPVVLKIASPDIVHKSAAGGVKLALKTSKQVGQAYDDILMAIKHKHPRAMIHGISVQKMAPPGVEVIIGMSKDAQFGPVLMFGLGGIWVEILKDVSFRIAPLNKRDAVEMIREIKGYPILEGYGSQAYLQAAVDALTKAKKATGKPVILALRPPLDLAGMKDFLAVQEAFVKAGLPVFHSPRQAARAIACSIGWYTRLDGSLPLDFKLRSLERK